MWTDYSLFRHSDLVWRLDAVRYLIPYFRLWETPYENKCRTQKKWTQDPFEKNSQLSTRSLRQILCGSHIKIWNLANHMRKQNKKMLNLLVKNWKLRVWCSLLHFFLWFARFQNLICEPQSIWRKVLVLSLLYATKRYLTNWRLHFPPDKAPKWGANLIYIK